MKSPKKIIIKMGTNVLSKPDGSVNSLFLYNIISQIAKFKKQGKEIIIVTSGAIGAAMGEVGIKKRPTSISKRQALAGIGQSILMHHYKQIFAEHKIPVAQILLTSDVFKNRSRATNLHNSIKELFKLNSVPIINENDPISIEEIDQTFGDNDILSASLAVDLKADLLIILTNVKGLCNKDPKKHKDCTLIKKVNKITAEIEKNAGGATGNGMGGMQSKIQAAKKATKQCDVIVASGKEKNVLNRILSGEEIGTLFLKK